MPTILVNGRSVTVVDGTAVAAAILMSGETRLHTSISGDPRGPLCGMGICFECRVEIDGVPHRRSCQTVCRDGMIVTTS